MTNKQKWLLADKIASAIEKECIKGSDYFFKYCTIEAIYKYLPMQIQFSRLVTFLTEEIDKLKDNIEGFAPCRGEPTDSKLMPIYYDNITKMAVFIHCRELLLNEKTTSKVRDAVMRFLMKKYHIRYLPKFESWYYKVDEDFDEKELDK